MRGRRSDDQAAVARLEEVYARYRASARRRRAWDPENPGNMTMRSELEHAVVASGVLDQPASLRVLDLGCGHGYWLVRLADLGVPPTQLTGVEVLPHRVAAAASAVPGAKIVEADAAEVPLPPRNFDVVLLFTVLSSVVDAERQRRVLREARRLTSDRGAILIYEPRTPNPLNTATRTVRRDDVRAVLGEPAVRYTLTLVPGVARRLGRATPLLYDWLVRIPPLRTHQLLVHRPNSISA